MTAETPQGLSLVTSTKKGLPKKLSPGCIYLESDRTNLFSPLHALKGMSDSAPNSPPVLPPGVDPTPLETTAKLITVHLFPHLFDHLKSAPSDERLVSHDPLLDHPDLRLKTPLMRPCRAMVETAVRSTCLPHNLYDCWYGSLALSPFRRSVQRDCRSGS